MARKTLYCIIDTETTMRNGLVFDFAYDMTDKNGVTQAEGSFLFKDVLSIEEPFYKEKIATYWVMAYKHKVKPMTVRAVQRHFNQMLKYYIAKGNKVVICAYNAAFDVSHLGMTSLEMAKTKFLTADTKHVMFMDLWHAWVMGCPIEYGYTAPLTHAQAGQTNPKTGKPFPFNIKTSAEAVYSYLTDNPKFIEAHTARADLIIEKVILLDILRRKKKLPIVDSPAKFVGSPWKIAQQRCREPIEFRKGKQQSMLEIISHVPGLSTKQDHMTE